MPVLGLAAANGGIELSTPTSQAVADIPPDYLLLYQQAGLAFDIPWQLLAGIGKVECDHGRNPNPACWKQGATNHAGAGGPMQFLPATWAAYGLDGDNDGVADRWDPADAIVSAANFLKANGAPDDIPAALYAYNHSAGYVDQVLHWANLYSAAPDLTASTAAGAPSAVAATAVQYALAQLGTPYRWGGEEPGGFDCSGLVQAAYQAAGIALPRTAQQQYDAGPLLPPGAPLQPGDLVFFGSDPANVTHVGICRSCQVDHVGIVVDDHGDMIDAPHTGAVVRIEPYTTWPNFIGATRPSLLATGSASGG